MRLPRGCCMPCSLVCPRDDRALWWPAAMAEAALFASASGSASRHFITRSSSRPVQGRGRRGRPARRTAGWRECVGRGGQPAVSGPLTSRLVGRCLPRVVPGRWPGRAGTAHRRFIDLRGSRPRSSLAHPFYFLKLFFLFFSFPAAVCREISAWSTPSGSAFRGGSAPCASCRCCRRLHCTAPGRRLGLGLLQDATDAAPSPRPRRLAGWLAGRTALPFRGQWGARATGRGGATPLPGRKATRPDHGGGKWRPHCDVIFLEKLKRRRSPRATLPKVPLITTYVSREKCK